MAIARGSDRVGQIVELVAEGDTVVARFTCSGTHTGVWLGHPPTHRRFHRVPEVYFFGFTETALAGVGAGKHPSTAPPTRARPTPSPRVLNRQNHELFRGGTDLSRMPSSRTA